MYKVGTSFRCKATLDPILEKNRIYTINSIKRENKKVYYCFEIKITEQCYYNVPIRATRIKQFFYDKKNPRQLPKWF